MEPRADGSAQLGVLLVEDSETIIEFLTMGLTDEGFTVHVVRDGRDAMAAFERVRPHLVLLDVMLPGTDGMTLCRALRARSTVAIHHADRAGRGRGPHRRVGQRSGRLPPQALQVRRVACSHPRGAAPPPDHGGESPGGRR